MTLIKTSLLNGIAVVIKMLTLLGLNKVLAIYVGPSGYAALGQFQNAVQMITTFASGAINTGVTKYTAEYHEDEARQHAVWRTAGTIALIGSLITTTVVIVFNRALASWFLKDEMLGSVFIWFAITLVLFVFNTLLLAILNGKKEIHRYVIANIAGSLFALAVTTIMAVKLGLYGALVALAVYQSVSFFATLLLCYKTNWFKVGYFFGKIDKQIAVKLSKFAIMALTSVICVPLSQIILREYIGENFGWQSAGYLEAMWRLSGAYLMLITTTLSVYFLPRLSEIKNSIEIRSEIIQGYKVILPTVIIGVIFIYLLRDYLILLLFTADFLPMRDLFAWQLIGDILKIGSWVLAYLMLSKAMSASYITLEIIFSLSYLALSWLFTRELGLSGVVIAYTVNYLFYWIFVAIAVRKLLFDGVRI